MSITSRKRLFDIVVTLLASPTWVPCLLVCATGVLLFSGWPVFYRSWRRVHRSHSLRVVKFRAMVRNAAAIANRETIVIGTQRFLNIPIDSPLYTPVGRILERFQLTELPQLFHVLRGTMSLVGNRPLPENVIAALRTEFPNVEDRFLAKCGLTGPTQLAGREMLPDDVRLRLETTYCRLSLEAYTFRLDFVLMLFTILRSLRLLRPMSAEHVEALMYRLTGQRTLPAPRRTGAVATLAAVLSNRRMPAARRRTVTQASFSQEEA